MAGLSWWEDAAQKLHTVSEQLRTPFRTLPSDEELLRAAQQQGMLVSQGLPAQAAVGAHPSQAELNVTLGF